MKYTILFSVILMSTLSCCQQKKITATEKETSFSKDSDKDSKMVEVKDTAQNEMLGEADKKSTKETLVSSNEKDAAGILPEQGLISKAFYTVTVPGAQQVDEKGNPIDNFIITREIFIEREGKELPQAITATTPDGLVYKGTAIQIPEGGISIGTTQIDNKKIFVKARPNNRIWKISLEPVGFTKQSTQPYKFLDVKAKFGSTAFKTRIEGETQLAGQPLY